MPTEPTIQGLKELLQELNLTELIEQLNDESFEDWKKRTKSQWKGILKDSKGNYIGFSDIYNYLNPGWQVIEMQWVLPATILAELWGFDVKTAEIIFKSPSITLDCVPTEEISSIVPLMKFVCREEPTKKLYRVLDDYLRWKTKPFGEAEKNTKLVTVVGTSGKGKTTFARRFIELPDNGEFPDIVADCKR